MLSNFQAPEVALDSLAIRQSEINAWVAGETVPRHFEQVDALLRLGRDYQRLELSVSGVCVTQAVLTWVQLLTWRHSPSAMLSDVIDVACLYAVADKRTSCLHAA